MDKLEKYCSPRFKTGEELDEALGAALDCCTESERAEAAAVEAHISEYNAGVYADGGTTLTHSNEMVLPVTTPGAKGYMEEARRYAEQAQAVAEKAETLDAKVEDVFGDLEEADSRFSAIENDIADLKYNPIEITSFSHNLPTQELGAVVSTVTLAWALSKAPVSLMLDGATVDPTLREKTLTGLEIAKTKTFTLTATDERGASASKTTSISFYNGIYSGAAAAPASIDSAFILGLTKTLTGTKNRTVKINGGDGLYAWYAYPKRLSKSLFNIGGFDYEWELETISFTNSLGYTEEYYIYRSGQYVPASLSVTVKDGG